MMLFLPRRPPRLATLPALTLLALATLLTSAACASSGDPASRGSRTLITAEELAELPNLTAFDAVRRLRPIWLRTRGGNAPVVYVDRVRTGGPGALRSIQATDVAEIRYLDSRDATMQYGTGHTGGAILVTTRSG